MHAELRQGNFKERSWFSKNVEEPVTKFIARNFFGFQPSDYLQLTGGWIVPMSESGTQFGVSETNADVMFFSATSFFAVFKLAKVSNAVAINKINLFADNGSKINVKTDFYVKPNGEAVPGTMYRYSDSSTFSELSKAKSSRTSYVTPKKFNKSEAAIDGLQIDAINWNNNCQTRSSFDSLQIIDDIRVPYSYGNVGPDLEPITKCYPEFGKGGVPQYIVNKEVYFDSVTKLQ